MRGRIGLVIVIPVIGLLMVLSGTSGYASPLQEEEQNSPFAQKVGPVGHTAATSIAYTITDLGSLGGAPSQAIGISENGTVVGWSTAAGSKRRAFLWQSGAMTQLPVPAAADSSAAYAVNNARQAAGDFGGFDPAYSTATRWANGSLTKLLESPDPESPWRSYASDINEDGLIVGFVSKGEEQLPFTWQNGTLTMLPPFGSGPSTVQATNDHGQIAGWFRNTQGNFKPILWLPQAAYGLPAGTNTLGVHHGGTFDINNHTQIVGAGKIISATSDFHAYLWLPEPAYGQPSGITDLGTLGGNSSEGAAINNYGQVVGASTTVSRTRHAFLWRNGLMSDLNEQIDPASGWELQTARDINDAGQIVGQGVLNGEQRAFMLTPQPVPWTQIHYFAADNDLGDTFPDIFQELEANAENPNINILVLWDYPVNVDSYYHVLYDPDPNQSATYIPGERRWPQPDELDTSKSETLSDFLIWSITNYPSQHYALFLNDHGNGLGGGLCDGSCDNMMTLVEMKEALATAFEATGRKIDVLYMDMCLMGMLEVAYQVRDYADYYVASEDIQFAYKDPYAGYTFGIGEDYAPATVAELFASSYAETAAEESDYYAIAAADLSHLDNLVSATNQLAAALMANINDVLETLTTVLLTVQRLDSESPRGIDLDDTYVDLYDFADWVHLTMDEHADIVAAAEAVKTAVDDYVIYEGHGSTSSKDLDNTHGVAIFYPSTPSVFYSADRYDFAVGATWEQPVNTSSAVLPSDKTWGALLVNYFALTQPDGPVDTTPPVPVAKVLPDVDAGIYLPSLRR